ncbi:hypothetical protein AAFF_G00217880 [Aldrovandia affinis]|uniref:Uncharacterized protein n=1 Tax=Aldrovandia affinis TaxID=143900 RepID=A0AAD7SVT7_9TELE|nr:hypothetical protein AAFF_G00217880 [Aldrovandia affinis]
MGRIAVRSLILKDPRAHATHCARCGSLRPDEATARRATEEKRNLLPLHSSNRGPGPPSILGDCPRLSPRRSDMSPSAFYTEKQFRGSSDTGVGLTLSARCLGAVPRVIPGALQTRPAERNATLG